MTLINNKNYNRDLSWLRFNHRVLQEAADSRNPLYERIKFIAIYSSNLDEFFKVRVSDIRQIKSLNKKLRKKLITNPNKLLKKIKKQVDLQGDELGEIFGNQIIPELKYNGIDLISYSEFDNKQKEFVVDYFESQLKAKVNIKKSLHAKEAHLYVENEKLYLISLDINKELVWVKIPDEIDRFVELPKNDARFKITFIDDILKYYLSEQFPDKFYSVKVSRDAELYLENEYSGNLLDKIKSSLSKRDTGQVTRAIVENKIPEDLLIAFKETLEINETDIVRGGVHHNLKDLFAFPNPTGKKLSLDILKPKRQKAFSDFDSLFIAITKKDRLLYFPYESFEDVIQFVQQAAYDAHVTVIKMTLYRISKDSAIANALLSALEKGKKVFVFIETKARFDEANNIRWGKKLEDKGANVIYSYPGIKVHSKIMYIERNEQSGTNAYGYIGTGNFNEKTSRIYTDFGLMTANKQITKEISHVFHVLERTIIIPKSKMLMISPFTTRSKFTTLIENEIENTNNGIDAYIILKLNSLQDPMLINLLYKASTAGVKIRILVRGICCLVPGIKGQSDNIYITSIVDRFLEHARVYIFANGGKELMYMGSADLMTRNIDHRIEVITPILDPDNYVKMRKAVQLQLDDLVKARIIDGLQKNKYVTSNDTGLSSQLKTYEQLV